MWLLALTIGDAQAGGAKAVQTVGLVVGVGGAALAGLGAGTLTGPEPFGFFALYPPGVLGLGLGTGLTVGSALFEAGKTGTDATVGYAGLGLAVAGVGGGVALAATGDETAAGVGVLGGPVLCLAGLVSGAVQGHHNRAPRAATLVPTFDRPGLAIAGTF